MISKSEGVSTKKTDVLAGQSWLVTEGKRGVENLKTGTNIQDGILLDELDEFRQKYSSNGKPLVLLASAAGLVVEAGREIIESSKREIERQKKELEKVDKQNRETNDNVEKQRQELDRIGRELNKRDKNK